MARRSEKTWVPHFWPVLPEVGILNSFGNGCLADPLLPDDPKTIEARTTLPTKRRGLCLLENGDDRFKAEIGRNKD